MLICNICGLICDKTNSKHLENCPLCRLGVIEHREEEIAITTTSTLKFHNHNQGTCDMCKKKESLIPHNTNPYYGEFRTEKMENLCKNCIDKLKNKIGRMEKYI